MCGFAGIIDSKSICNPGIITDMMNSIQHRGPDDCYYAMIDIENQFINTNKSIRNDISSLQGMVGFNRLSIRDVSLNGRQPMTDKSNKVMLVFNGEIYNTEDLKNFLNDYSFKGNSDTEVILALYLKFGFEKMVKLLNGMFSITIIDLRVGKIYLTRDRVGIKPLYYFNNTKQIMFASEIKCFLFNPEFKRNINLDALKEFFVFGDAINDVLLKDIKEVLPGEWVDIDLTNLTFEEVHHLYFNLDDYIRPLHCNKNLDSQVNELHNILIDTVESQLVSDVRVGCQLSGGVDSSVITYLAHQKGLTDTISIIQDTKGYSEEEYIKFVNSKMSGISDNYFKLTDDFIVENFSKSIWHYENIMTYHNVVALLGMAQKARENVTVLLSGEGADELFGGYTWFEDGVLATNYFKNSSKMARPNVRGLSNASSYSEFAVMATDTIPIDISAKMFNFEIPYSQIKEKRIQFFDSFHGCDFDKHIKYEMSTRLRSLLLRQDKATMAYSIENRVPILDNNVIDFAFSLPQSSLIGVGKPVGKLVLKRLCEKIYGEEFAYRRKMGLPLPIHKYMMNVKFREYFYDMLLPSIKTRGIMNSFEIQSQYEKLNENENRWTFAPLWKALSFEVWCSHFIDHNY